jgi:hypothetical protein
LLPEDLKKALFDEEISNKIYEMGEKFNVPKEKMEALAQISGKVFLGVLVLENLKEELKTNLGISPEDAEGLYQNLNDEIFSKYKESLDLIEVDNRGPAPLDTKLSNGVNGFAQKSEVGEEKKEISEEARQEEIKMRKELLQKKGSDRYREPIETEELEKSRVVRNGGRIKKVL